MNPAHLNNQEKWRAFQALGYDVHSEEGRQIGANLIIAQLTAHLEDTPAALDDPSVYGIRFTVLIPITGLNNVQGLLVTKWQIDRNQQFPRLITNWLKVFSSQEQLS